MWKSTLFVSLNQLNRKALGKTKCRGAYLTKHAKIRVRFKVCWPYSDRCIPEASEFCIIEAGELDSDRFRVGRIVLLASELNFLQLGQWNQHCIFITL